MSDAGILVVDDSPDNLFLISILLERENFDVRTAQDAGEALTVLKKFRPELILMDIQMPGIDGLELTRALKKSDNLRDVPVVALTAYAMKGDEENARAAGCCGYITKPIDTRSFGELIRGYLAEAACPAALHG